MTDNLTLYNLPTCQLFDINLASPQIQLKYHRQAKWYLCDKSTSYEFSMVEYSVGDNYLIVNAGFQGTFFIQKIMQLVHAANQDSKEKT